MATKSYGLGDEIHVHVHTDGSIARSACRGGILSRRHDRCRGEPPSRPWRRMESRSPVTVARPRRTLTGFPLGAGRVASRPANLESCSVGGNPSPEGLAGPLARGYPPSGFSPCIGSLQHWSSRCWPSAVRRPREPRTRRGPAEGRDCIRLHSSHLIGRIWEIAARLGSKGKA